MPVLLADASSGECRAGERKADPIVIGLVNNMPDAAIRATERQFGNLLHAAAGEIEVRLRFFSLPDVPRTASARSTFLGSYEDINELWKCGVDGLIVTGAEPRTPDLIDEPYWGALTQLIDWAENNTVSTIWSCLAAHAAVLHMDGIQRHAFDDKLSGIFECVKTAEHKLVAGSPPRWRVPHSRLNGLRPDDLAARGYSFLSSSTEAGVDMFFKQKKSLFLFLQGHLEYDSDSLLREYLRDITRFLNHERDMYPEMPRGYFDDGTAAIFTQFREKALRNRNERLPAEIAGKAAEGRLLNAWRSAATNIYRNWLRYISEQKALTQGPAQGHASDQMHAV
jgi:homoserine O-succinyltransferase/O-acetyltransferase